MAEVTSIITLRITVVGDIPNDELEARLEKRQTTEFIRRMENNLMSLTGLDDVNITEIQDFVMDEPAGELFDEGDIDRREIHD